MASVFTRRAIAFVIAVILAIVAAVAVYSYLQGVEEDAAEELDAVIAYVATQEIEPGTLADTAIQTGAIESREIPRSLLAEGAITDLNQITGRTVEEVILPGDQIISARFTAPGEQAQVLAIPPDNQAMSFEVGVPPGVAGFVDEGDRISVIAYLEVPDPDQGTETVENTETGTVTQQEATENRAQFVLQDVEVLAVGQREAPSEEEADGGTVGGTAAPINTVLLTVAVTPSEAERLAFATLSGSLYLTLLPEDQTDPVDTPGRTADNIFDPGS